MQPIWISRKRTLGLAFIAAGALGAIGIFMLDVVRTSDQHGIGPAQKIALAGCVAIALLGVTLALFGIDPETKTKTLITDSAPRTIVWLQRILIGAAVGLMLFHLIFFLVFSLALVRFSFDYGQGDGFYLNGSFFLSQS